VICQFLVDVVFVSYTGSDCVVEKHVDLLLHTAIVRWNVCACYRCPLGVDISDELQQCHISLPRVKVL